MVIRDVGCLFLGIGALCIFVVVARLLLLNTIHLWLVSGDVGRILMVGFVLFFVGLLATAAGGSDNDVL